MAKRRGPPKHEDMEPEAQTVRLTPAKTSEDLFGGALKMENHLQLPVAAKKAGVSARTLKFWLRQAGYNMPRRESYGRYTILVSEKVLERLIEEHTPQVART